MVPTEKPYYLAPGKGGAKVYSLLRQALSSTGKVAVGSFVMHQRQHMCAIAATGTTLTLLTLRFEDEIVPMSAGDSASAKVTPPELTMAKQLDTGRITSKLQLRRHLRRHVDHELYDESGEPAAGDIAIYSLSDPSDLITLRYIGQSAAPRRRLFQHLNAARLWMPAEHSWWVRDPRLRPLYDWIRTLYRADGRLPTMVIWEWTEGPRSARAAERTRICDGLSQGWPLLNVEAERAHPQRQLI